jgi:transcriptional regulator with XRE-family HTH domain
MSEETIAETLGQRVRRIRAERGLSQRDVQRPGVTAVYVCRIERGDRYPSVQAIRKIADGLGVTPRYLETGACPLMDGLRRAGLDYADLDTSERRLLEQEHDFAVRDFGLGFGLALGVLRDHVVGLA